MPRLLLSCALLASFLGLAGVPKTASCKLKHGLFWYGSAPSDSVRALVAKRYSTGVTGKGPNDFEKAQIKTLNPEFRWYVYNSATDNYVPPNQDTAEHDALVSLARENGWDPEILYLHYWDDTQLVLEGDTVFVPGWGGGTSADPAQSRVPVYYKDQSRRVCNFSTRQAASVYREIMVRFAFDTPFTGTSLYPDGIFLDNCTAELYNYGSTIVSGGHVREAPFHLLIGSNEFDSWWWGQNLGPFLTSLKDTLESSAAWSKDHERKYLMNNVANIWNDDYARRDVADVLAMEFQYNPVRNVGVAAIDQSYQRDVMSALSGITSFYMATNTRTVNGHPGSYGLSEVMLGNLCWFLLSRSPNSIFYQQGTNTPSAAGWDSLTWIGAMDVANKDLGEAVGPPYVLAEGTDPLGNPYAVHARNYENGIVVLRNRGNWDEGIEPATTVTVSLPDTFMSISPEGSVQSSATSVALRNGQGALFLNPKPVALPPPPPSPPLPPPDNVPPDTTTTTVFSLIPSLNQNVPNPAHAGGRMDIEYSVAQEGVARLEVFDLAGRRVAVLRDGFLTMGHYSSSWDGTDERGIPLSPGVYFYRLQSADGTMSRKLLIMR